MPSSRFWKTVTDISGWARTTGSADLTRRRESFRNYFESDGLAGNFLKPVRIRRQLPDSRMAK